MNRCLLTLILGIVARAKGWLVGMCCLEGIAEAFVSHHQGRNLSKVHQKGQDSTLGVPYREILGQESVSVGLCTVRYCLEVVCPQKSWTFPCRLHSCPDLPWATMVLWTTSITHPFVFPGRTCFAILSARAATESIEELFGRVFQVTLSKASCGYKFDPGTVFLGKEVSLWKKHASALVLENQVPNGKKGSGFRNSGHPTHPLMATPKFPKSPSTCQVLQHHVHISAPHMAEPAINHSS